MLLLAALVAALIAPAEAAGAPFTIGEGHSPGVAVDAAGTAYIAWYGPETGDTSLRFCRLPRGATACAGQATIATPGGSSLSRPAVVVAGARVTIVQYRFGDFAGGFNQIFRFTSVDGGNSFDTGTPAGYVPFDEAAVGPGDTLSVVTSAFQEGGLLQNVPLSSGSSGQTRAGLFGGERPYNGTVGPADSGTMVAVFATADSQAAVRVFRGAGAINDAAAWGPETGIGYADYPKLAGGPAGLFLLHGTANGGLEVRRWNGTTFPAGVSLATAGEDAQAHLYQDPGGRLHAVWPRIDADGFHLVHAVSDDGVNWDSGTLLIQTDDVETQLRVAAAADHVGVAAWESRSGGTTQIRVSAVGPGAPGVPLPQFHKTVVVRPVSGKVRVKLPGSSRFVDLSAVDDVPLGASVDVKRGRLALSSVPSRTGAAQTTQLYGGMFKVTQPGSITQFALSESLASCGRRARAAASKPKSRKLWGDGKGKFRTRGQYSAATVRGTKWLVQDSCSGTLTRVTQGSVSVRDNVKHKTIILRAGKRYTARPRG